jgi:predicted DNA-binding transcriptional regulator AlpA
MQNGNSASRPPHRPVEGLLNSTETSGSNAAQPDGLLTEDETTAYLGIVPNTLAKWRTRGEGPPFVRVGRLIRYDRAAIDRWVASQTRQSTSDPGPDARAAGGRRGR